MPTYTCVSKRGLLSTDQRRRIATGITRVHSAATGAPIAFTQCIFQDIDDSGHFIGGEPGPPDNVFVYGHIRGGRNVAQRAEILDGVRDLVIEAVGCEPSSAWGVVNDYALRAPLSEKTTWPAPSTGSAIGLTTGSRHGRTHTSRSRGT